MMAAPFSQCNFRTGVLKPRVVVVDYNASFGADRSVTILMTQDLTGIPGPMIYHGASLLALSKLAIHKGYRLVGCDSIGLNAFFVLDELQDDRLPTVDVQTAYRPNKSRVERGLSQTQQIDMISHLPLVEIE